MGCVSVCDTADRLGVSGSDRPQWVAIPHGVLPPRLRRLGLGLSQCVQRAYRQGWSIVAGVAPNSFGLVVPVLVLLNRWG